MAGAVLHGTAGAQVRDTLPKKRDTTVVLRAAQPDSMLRDSLAKKAALDSARLARLDSIQRADTVESPIAHSERPVDIGIARRLHWDRDSLFATGAITLADLLERVPGLTGLHAGWIAAPAVGAYLGDTRRVRVFYDGFEHLPLDPRVGGVIDLTQINLWSAEDVTIEQGPEEVRVYLRSWRVTKTIPETRTDVSTGDQATNMYRGFFGRRWRNGFDLQFAAQQFGTTPPAILGPSSTQTGAIGRIGWSNQRWSVDGYITHIGRDRGEIFAEIPIGSTIPLDSIAGVSSSRSDTYVRVAYADPDTSRYWAQAMAVYSYYNYTGLRTLPLITFPQTAADSAFNTLPLDTSTVRRQYVFTAGSVYGPLRVSAGERIVAGGTNTQICLTPLRCASPSPSTFSIPSLRAAVYLPFVAVSGFAEAKSSDSVSRADVTAQLTPLSFVSVLGAVGRTKNYQVRDSTITTNYTRAELGLRVKNLWLLGGIVHRDSIRVTPPTEFNTPRDTLRAFTVRNELSATGGTVAIRGQLWRILHADVSAIRWNDSAGFYRPRYQTRSELFLHTNLLNKIPSGNLGITAGLVHEYRSGVLFPRGFGVDTVPGYRTISSLLEIRILTATISWQFRNFLGERYIQVPRYLMPRQTNFYGVRWSFFG